MLAWLSSWRRLLYSYFYRCLLSAIPKFYHCLYHLLHHSNLQMIFHRISKWGYFIYTLLILSLYNKMTKFLYPFLMSYQFTWNISQHIMFHTYTDKHYSMLYKKIILRYKNIFLWYHEIDFLNKVLYCDIFFSYQKMGSMPMFWYHKIIFDIKKTFWDIKESV